MVQHKRELETAIDALVKSYEAPLEINNLAAAALPNKRAVVEAFRHLLPLIYLGFYSKPDLDTNDLHSALREHAYPSYDLLIEQIERVLAYERRFHGGSKTHGYAEEVVLGLFRKLPEIRLTLGQDLTAAYEGDPAARSVEEIVYSYPAVEAITAYRVAHELHVREVPIIPRIISDYAHSRTGVDLHPGARIGARFFLDHGTGVVVGETSVIGSNVKVYQGVTLGALSTRRVDCSSDGKMRKRHPTIEDNVTIYAGATILGGETVIGAGSVIGGNVWLTQSVPPGSKIFGRARE